MFIEGTKYNVYFTGSILNNIGYVQLVSIEEGWEIGYHIAKKYTGNGYATEAVLDKDFLENDINTIPDGKVVATIVDGNVVYTA